MTSQEAMTADLRADLAALWSLTVTALSAHTDAAGLRTVCGCAWPCELVLLADHNYGLSWVGARLRAATGIRPAGPCGSAHRGMRAFAHAQAQHQADHERNPPPNYPAQVREPHDVQPPPSRRSCQGPAPTSTADGSGLSAAPRPAPMTVSDRPLTPGEALAKLFLDNAERGAHADNDELVVALRERARAIQALAEGNEHSGCGR